VITGSDPRDVAELVHQLGSAARAADKVATHLVDLHGLAFEKHVAGLERTSGTAWPPPGVEDVGDPQARALWRQVLAAQHHLAAIVALGSDTMNFLSAGPSPVPTRGSLNSKGEHVGRLRNQRKQAEAGAHIPPRLVDQPAYPGSGR
jgi:hypothetical protein